MRNSTVTILFYSENILFHHRQSLCAFIHQEYAVLSVQRVWVTLTEALFIETDLTRNPNPTEWFSILFRSCILLIEGFPGKRRNYNIWYRLTLVNIQGQSSDSPSTTTSHSGSYTQNENKNRLVLLQELFANNSLLRINDIAVWMRGKEISVSKGRHIRLDQCTVVFLLNDTTGAQLTSTEHVGPSTTFWTLAAFLLIPCLL